MRLGRTWLGLVGLAQVTLALRPLDCALRDASEGLITALLAREILQVWGNRLSEVKNTFQMLASAFTSGMRVHSPVRFGFVGDEREISPRNRYDHWAAPSKLFALSSDLRWRAVRPLFCT